MYDNGSALEFDGKLRVSNYGFSFEILIFIASSGCQLFLSPNPNFIRCRLALIEVNKLTWFKFRKSEFWKRCFYS